MTVSWRRGDGAALPAGRHSDNGVGFLVVTSVRQSDAGKYVCEATDGVYLYVADAILDVAGEGGGTEGGGEGAAVVPPSARVDQSYARARAGDRLELFCLVGGRPEPRVNWRRSGGGGRGGLPRGARLEDGGRRLVFDAVTKADEGEYVCSASNQAGTREDTAIVFVSGRGTGKASQ